MNGTHLEEGESLRIENLGDERHAIIVSLHRGEFRVEGLPTVTPEDQLKALLAAGLAQATVLQILGELSPDAPHFQDAIQTARDDWARCSNNELEIDAKPLLSPCPDDGGCWVSAWVWVGCEFDTEESV